MWRTRPLTSSPTDIKARRCQIGVLPFVLILVISDFLVFKASFPSKVSSPFWSVYFYMNASERRFFVRFQLSLKLFFSFSVESSYGNSLIVLKWSLSSLFAPFSLLLSHSFSPLHKTFCSSSCKPLYGKLEHLRSPSSMPMPVWNLADINLRIYVEAFYMKETVCVKCWFRVTTRE